MLRKFNKRGYIILLKKLAIYLNDSVLHLNFLNDFENRNKRQFYLNLETVETFNAEFRILLHIWFEAMLSLMADQ